MTFSRMEAAMEDAFVEWVSFDEYLFYLFFCREHPLTLFFFL